MILHTWLERKPNLFSFWLSLSRLFLTFLCQDETIDMDSKKMRRCYTSLRTLFLLMPSSNGFILTGNFYHHICLISKGNFNSLLTIYFQSQAIKFDCHILAYTVAFTMIFWQAKYIFIHEIFVGKYWIRNFTSFHNTEMKTCVSLYCSEQFNTGLSSFICIGSTKKERWVICYEKISV